MCSSFPKVCALERRAAFNLLAPHYAVNRHVVKRSVDQMPIAADVIFGYENRELVAVRTSQRNISIQNCRIGVAVFPVTCFAWHLAPLQ